MNLISILYIRTNNHTDEKISVGMFAVGNDRRFFSYSLRKIKLSNEIIDANLERTIVNSLKRIKAEIDAFNKAPIKFKDFGFNDASFTYLNNYSKGILSFEKLKPVSIEINDATYLKLFNLMIDSPEDKTNIISFSKKVSLKLKNKAFDKIDTKYSLSAEIIRSYAPHKVDFIGKNGSLLVGQSVDFNGRPETVDKSLMEFKTISNSLIEYSKLKGFKKAGDYNIYFSTPDSSEGKKLLDRVIKDKNRLFNMFELGEIDTVINNLESGSYIKFSDFINSNS